MIERLSSLGGPPHILSALELLQFRNPPINPLANLCESDQRPFLEWCDRKQITLLLGFLAERRIPLWLAKPLRQRRINYGYRLKRLKTELLQIAQALDEAGLEFVMLKGLSHAPALTPNAHLRAQGDIDLWLLGESVYQARDILTKLGYVPLLHSKSRHLAPMGKPSNWKWRGDLFDPEMPISVELHYELWSEKAEHIAVPSLEQLWTRKHLREFDGRHIHVLCEEDLVGFAALHLLLHLLHGELPLQRAWEIARFLHNHATDEQFWASWRTLHSPELKQLEVFVFRLVSCWFGCDNAPHFDADFVRLPAAMKSWLQQYGPSPLKREWAPNKSELWLHLALINEPIHKFRVFIRRVIPMSLPNLNDRAQSQQSVMSRLAVILRNLPLLTARLVRHAATLVPTLLEGARWHRSVRKL